MNESGSILASGYDFRLIALSVAIAICASYTALDLVSRIVVATGRHKRVWLSGGATVMGLGIWSMHYIGMLAFHLTAPVQYDWPTVLASLLAAILASAIALFVVSQPKMRYGGEEFLVVLPGCDGGAAIEQGERMRKALCNEAITVANFTISVSMSVGVALRCAKARNPAS